MALTNAFYEAVNTGNVRRVRIMMNNSLLFDLTFDEFHEMEKVVSSMEGLYDEHDGKEFILDKSKWNDDYMNTIMVDVLYNFSHERINHIKDVVRFLRPVANNATSKSQETGRPHHYDNTPKGSYEEEKRRCQANGDYLYAKIGMGAVAGAAVGGAVAVVAGVTVIGGAVVGAVVGGVAAVAISNGGKKS